MPAAATVDPGSVADPSPFGPVPGAPPAPHDLDTLWSVAEEQLGLVTRQQCLSAGLTDRAIQHRVATGRWVTVHPGVYLTTPGRDGWWMQATAAQLAVAGSAWSYRTAGYAYGLVTRAPAVIDLLVAAPVHAAPPRGAAVHRSRYTDNRVDDRRWPWRTTFEETVLDLAELGTEDDVLAMLGRAFQRGTTTEGSLRRLLGGRSRHRRRALLGEVLEDVDAGAHSAMEVRYVRDVERPHGLPVGRRQRATWAQGVRLHDVGYDEQRVLVELDGRLGHESRQSRIHDGIRDRRGAGSGWLTVRAFWRDVAGHPCDLAVDVGAVLTDRGMTHRIHRCRRPDCTVPD